jgi:hypothetical protein
MEHCDECGFTYDQAKFTDVATLLRTIASRHAGDLVSSVEDHGEQIARVRPTPEVWSALEYTCHVRDVLLVQRDRVILALVEDSPSFPRMYRDERVALAGYAEESPEEVAGQLIVAAGLAVKVFERLSDEQAQRPCTYNYPRPTERNVAWLGLHTVHEAEHHLGDVRSVLARANSPR